MRLWSGERFGSDGRKTVVPILRLGGRPVWFPTCSWRGPRIEADRDRSQQLMLMTPAEKKKTESRVG